MASAAKRLQQALRSGSPQAYESALDRLPDLPWEEKDDYVPIRIQVQAARPRTSWCDALPARVTGEADALFRILSAGVKVYKAPYEKHSQLGPEHNEREIVPFVPEWALVVDPDVKKMQKMKDNVTEQKAELCLAAIKKTWG